MIQLMRRILAVSGHYKGRIPAAFIFSFLKSLLAKAPIGLAFLVLTAFFYDSVTVLLCIWLGVGMVLCVVLQCLFQHAADRLDVDKRQHWSPTTVAAIVRDEIYIGTRIWGKTRCSMHTGHEGALAILKGVRDRYEAHHKVKITDEALQAAVSLSDRYISCLLYTSRCV